MSFLRNIAKLFSPDPITVRMSLVPYGVELALYEDTRLLGHQESLSDKIQAKLPPPLATLIKNQAMGDKPTYLLALPHAQKLLDDLKRYPPDKIQLDCTAVQNLRQITRPPDFQVHWRYNAVRQRIELQFNGTEHYLGYGWFHRQQQVWQLSSNLSAPMLTWLNRLYITGPDIFQFVATLLPNYQQANLPVSCDLTIETGLQLKLNIVKMLKKSIEVQLTANMPSVLAKLQYIEGDSLNMLSGTKLLPGLRPLFTPQLYALTRDNTPQKIEGEALPDFLQHIKLHATSLGIDRATLDEAYPILDAAGLDLVWKLEHEEVGGIGRYQATPWLEVGPISLPFKAIADEVLRKTRFYWVNEVWIELTEAYQNRHRNWINQQVARFQLFGSEILGTPTERLKATRLTVPQIEHKISVDEVQTAKDFLALMSRHGVPVTLGGLQKEIPNLLAGQCQRLLQQSVSTKILWITAKTKLPIIQSALKQANVPTYSGFPTRSSKSFPGGVYLVLPGMGLPTDMQWDVFILHEIDTLPMDETQTKLYGTVKRLWAITTFEKTQRLEQEHHIKQAMLLLQMTDTPLPLFRQHCLLVGSDQEEGWLNRFTSPFRKLFIADAPNPSSGVPIPQRPEPSIQWRSTDAQNASTPRKDQPSTSSQDQLPSRLSNQPQPLPPTVNVFRPTFENATTVAVASDSFIDQAKRFVNRTETQAVPMPFMEYWPTYAVMSDAQLRWYFFWRTQLRQGNFLPTDLSYLFLHTYEVLNLVGFTTPVAAFDYLVKFWNHYRVLQPKLDNYLIDWLADFLVVYTLPQSPLNWYASLVTAGTPLADRDLAIQAWLQAGGDFLTLSSPILYGLAGYSPLKNKFYQTHNQNNQIDLAYKRGLQAINEHVQQTTNLSLFAQHRPKVVQKIERAAFAGARYEGNKTLLKIADVYPWTTAESLPTVLQQIIKYTENLIRTQVGFKQKLRGIEISESWAAILDRTFSQPETHRTIQIDLAKVETLKFDADELRQRLLVEDEPPTNDVLDSTPHSTENDKSVAQSNTNHYTQRPEDTPANLLTDLVGVAAVLGDATTSSAKLLHTLYTHNWLAQPTILASRLDSQQFLNVVIDEINERAVEHLGDALLFQEADGWVVADDYRDEIAYILEHPDYATPPTIPAVTPATDTFSELEVEWASFVQQMQPYHWEGIAALLQTEDVMNRLEAIARANYSTANQLVDELNTFALNSIGDIVINASHDPPVLEAENRENLRMLMQWAIEHALVYQ